MNVIKKYYEEHELGQTWESQGRTIEITDIINFANYTWDVHPMTTDEEFAKNTPFKGRFAAGAMTMAYSIGLIYDNNILSFTYGHERLRYPNPVYPGDTIRVKATVIEMKEYPKDPKKWGFVTNKYETTNQRGEVVFVCHHVTMVQKRNNKLNQ